jgi:hypothetical protein
MARSQFIPPPDLAPPSIAGLSPVDRVRLWAQLVDEGDRILYESFLRQHGDATAARRAMQEWLDRREAESYCQELCSEVLNQAAFCRTPSVNTFPSRTRTIW